MCDYPQHKYKPGDIRTKNNVKIGHWEEDVFIKCGKCYKCRLQNMRSWLFRLSQECLEHSCTHFVTLTYDNEHVPITPKGFLTLQKKDVQTFIRYLRRKQKEKIKFLAVGEYGTVNKRPHYHILLFNVRNPESIYQSWIDNEGIQKGEIHIGEVTEKSIAYTLEYISVYEQPLPDWKDIQPTFKLQSTGLGKAWLDKGGRSFLEKNVPTFLNVDKTKIGIPKYYKDQVYKDEILKDNYHEKIRMVITELKNDEYYNNTLEQLEQKRRARLNKLKTKKSKKQ